MLKLKVWTTGLFLTSALFFAAAGEAPARGQGVAGASPADAPPGRARPADALGEATAGYVKAGEEYRESLRQLLALHEKSVARESGRVKTLRGLYGGGLVSKRELESAAARLAEAEARVKELRLQVEAADHFLAEALLEEEATKGAGSAPRTVVSRGALLKTSHVRFAGSGVWAPPDAGRVEEFFSARFGRRLPVTAYGQSELHTRWGFDHRQSMDVGLHPDSAEGQALVAYLRRAGIPFIAFRSAVPGSATGPHIHIGRPSQRLRGR